ncbi:MAG: hypothetical protein JJT94_04985 [Bernardetiaceae bacterium]|nr:hypothetical protein [Bernardetiaceae bacterium]
MIQKVKRSLSLYLLLAVLMLSACRVTKVNVGEYRTQQGRAYTYAKGKQLWILWGIIPLTRTNVNTPSHGNCQVIGKQNLGDTIITFLTGGIITSRTIKIKVKRNQEDSSEEYQ